MHGLHPFLRIMSLPHDPMAGLILPLVDTAVPEWQTTLDALLSLPDVADPVGFSGGVISTGIRLALIEPHIAGAVLFAGSVVPRIMFGEAPRVKILLHVLLQWDDEGNDRQVALDVFDAFRLSGEDAVRQHGRPYRRSRIRQGRRGQVLRPPPDANAIRQDEHHQL